MIKTCTKCGLSAGWDHKCGESPFLRYAGSEIKAAPEEEPRPNHTSETAANDLKERLRQHISDFLGSLTKERGSLVPSVRVVLCEDGTMIAIVDPTQLVRYTPEV